MSDDAAEIIRTWAHQSRFFQEFTGDRVILGWSDLDLAIRIERNGELFDVIFWERGRDRETSTFERLVDAERYVVQWFSGSWRRQAGRSTLFGAKEVALGATLDSSTRPHRLTWDVSWATFERESAATRFSYVTHLPLPELSRLLYETD